MSTTTMTMTILTTQVARGAADRSHAMAEALRKEAVDAEAELGHLQTELQKAREDMSRHMEREAERLRQQQEAAEVGGCVSVCWVDE
jgi:hypothetical protein